MLQYHLIDLQLFHQVRVDTFTAHKPLDHAVHSLLFQGIRHIIEQILVWNSVQSLQETRQFSFICRKTRKHILHS